MLCGESFQVNHALGLHLEAWQGVVGDVMDAGAEGQHGIQFHGDLVNHGGVGTLAVAGGWWFLFPDLRDVDEFPDSTD